MVKQSETLARIDRLEERIAALEAARPETDASDDLGIPQRMRELDRKLAEKIADREGPSPTGVDGIVEHALYLKMEKGAIGSDESLDVAEIFDVDAEVLATSLTGLAHPVRIAIYRALIAGAKESSDLLAITELNTTGQLYHHLSVMEKAGLVDRRTRNLWSASNHPAAMLAMSGGLLLAKWRGEVPG